MATDLTIVLEDRPGTLARAFEAVGRAGINIDGGAGFAVGGQGVLHVLVADGPAARRALEHAGIQVSGEEAVITCPVEDRPGAAGAIFRRISDAGVNIDLFYLTAGGELVIGADDLGKAEQAAAMGM